MDRLLNELSQFAKVETNYPLSKMTTLHIGGNARYVLYPENTVALDAVIQILKKENIPYRIFGNGSNILCSDAYYDGAIIRLKNEFDSYYFQDETIIAQAGTSIVALSYAAMKRGLEGLEFASGIPGTVGGVTFMNAGAYNTSMSNIIDSVFVYRNDKFEWMSNEECDFAYRHSIFQSHPDWLIIAVKFVLKKGNTNEIRDLIDNRRERRMASQPLDKPCCGSVFQNPSGENAWKFIDGIGYRGKSIGMAQVSMKHANFIVNNGGASAADYARLIQEIQEKVKEKYGIDLHTEVVKFNWQ